MTDLASLPATVFVLPFTDTLLELISLWILITLPAMKSVAKNDNIEQIVPRMLRISKQASQAYSITYYARIVS
jgi:hypothetical protein